MQTRLRTPGAHEQHDKTSSQQSNVKFPWLLHLVQAFRRHVAYSVRRTRRRGGWGLETNAGDGMDAYADEGENFREYSLLGKHIQKNWHISTHMTCTNA